MDCVGEEDRGLKEGLEPPWNDTLRRLGPLLPGDLFQRLRDFSPSAEGPAEGERDLAEALLDAIRALDSLHHTLTTFLPRYLLDLAPKPEHLPYGELLEGSFIFADVTGFTALTGELSKRGTEGREEMNRLMRALFGAVLDPLLASGGDLLIFAGDAVLALFPAAPESRDAQRAARTALRLVRAIKPLSELETPYGTFSLTMSAGVERGHSFAAVVGNRQRIDLLISGGPVQGATDAEGQAEPGQVVAGPTIRPLLEQEFQLEGDTILGLRSGELDHYEATPPTRRRRRLSAIFSRAVPDLIEHLQHALTEVESLTPLIPADLFAQIARGEDIRQHPPVAVQFVNLLGIEDLALGPAGPEHAAAVLQRYFTQAQEVVTDREGIISQVDPYAKGFTLLNPFGAPTHHEGVPRLAASAALELKHVLARVNREFDLNPPLTQRVGLTYDRIFTGEIGYRHRREYVVAGPAVNLAARLMSKAEPGQIVLDPDTWNRVQEDFRARQLPPLELKGIPEPVSPFDLHGLRRGRGLQLTDYPLVGRREELAQLEQRLEGAIEGEGAALAIVGPAGVGKSRLTARLAEIAPHHGAAALIGRCRPFAQTTPYLPWADLVSQLFGLEDNLDPTERRQQLRQGLRQLDLESFFPACADLLGLPPAALIASPEAAPSDQDAGLFAALKRETPQEQEQGDVEGLAAMLSQRIAQAESQEPSAPSIWEVLSERVSIPHALRHLLEQLTSSQPVLLIIEDIQWMDPDSRRVLEKLIGHAASWPLLLVVTARPESEWEGERLSLPPLTRAESDSLAALALRARALDADLAFWLHERARGNPLFILSYCRALRDANAVVVDPATDQARWNGPPPPLPLSLQELLLAQVNRLEQRSQEALRQGAVIGTTFDTQLLSQLYRETHGEGRLNDMLDQAARRSLVAPPPPTRAHTFSSQPLHDAVYAALSHALRRSWHGQVAHQLAQADPTTRYERLEQIAGHYSRSDNLPQAAYFTRRAGDKARARRADEVAWAFYKQTVALGDRYDAVDSQGVAVECRRAREGIGDLHALHAEREQAHQAYQAVLDSSTGDEAPRIGAKLSLLTLLDASGEPESVEQARGALPPSDPMRDWLDAALIWLHAKQGDSETAAALGRELLPNKQDPVKGLLEEAVERLQSGASLRPAEDLFALFAQSQLRLPPRGEND